MTPPSWPPAAWSPLAWSPLAWSPLAWTMLVASLPIALAALLLTIANLRRYRTLDTLNSPGTLDSRETVDRSATQGHATAPLLSVCIPARNEEANLERCLAAVLAGTSASGTAEAGALEVLVYDDQSTDRTPEILASISARDARVRATETVPLPAGWNGKQHACDRMGRAARGSWLLFTDADVTFSSTNPQAPLVERLAPAFAFALRRNIALLSTFPRQRTESLAERLIVPMIHFILFSYLPMGRMRSTLDPAASAACGQFMLVRKDAYLAAGGHAAFKASMHDGVMMPRALRRAGFKTDLFDGTALCSVRMYSGLASTWRGFAKNAYEGLGNPALLVLLTSLHTLGHILPWCVLAWWIISSMTHLAQPSTLAGGLALACVACNIAQRSLLARRFSLGPVGIILHPVGVLLMTAIQWHSAALFLFGKRSWRGRTA